jgi:hypothetical protein
MHTLKLQNIDRNGKFIKGHVFVSGTILDWTPTHFTLKVEHHDDWRGTSHVQTHRIDRKRIRSSSNRIALGY